MKKEIRSLWFGLALALVFGVASAGSRLSAQQTAPAPDQAPARQQQQQPQPAPDTAAPTQADSGTVFSGTIAKDGTKYVLNEASGKTYDLDRQDIAKQYEGKQVRVKGTLDPDGKTIHVR